MAKNTTEDYRKFRYYEGVCSSSDFIKELAKVVSLGVKSDAKVSIDGEVIEEAEPLRLLNWDIVYPMVDSNFEGYQHLNSRDKYLGKTGDSEDGCSNFTSRWTEKLENQIAQITDRVVLRTTTSAINTASSEEDDLSVSGESDQASTTMYVQIYKPKYLANPEEYPLDAELKGLIPRLITKDMYKEARKTTTSVIYDLSQKVSFPKTQDYSNINCHTNDNLITKEIRLEYVDSVSNAYSRDYLYGEDGILKGLIAIINPDEITLDRILPEPSGSDKTSDTTLTRAHLNAIKQTNSDLYNFIFGICGLRTTFTSNDYDLIDKMKIKVSLLEKDAYYVSLIYQKNVEVFTIHADLITAVDGTKTSYFDVENEYGNPGLDNLLPELYSEGRYVPLSKEYFDEPGSKSGITFKKDIKFCLDKTVDSSIYYGTIVLRYDYDKHLDYVNLDSLNITESVTLENNHYCLIRMFDNPNSDFSGPEPNIIDNNGNITSTNSHTSPWSKLSWYQDFEEIMMDQIDEDVSVTSVTDGTLLVPLETAGLTSDTRISYWINTNNNRFSLIVMGNPALDYERDRHLISSCYIGRIDSFENSINDVSGNFALYTSSSTTPCKTYMNAYDTQYHINRDFDNKYFLDNTSYKLSDVSSELYPGAIDKNTNIEAYKAYCEKHNGIIDFSVIKEVDNPDYNIVYITLTGNKFFNEEEIPRYMILDENGDPINIKNSFDDEDVFYDTVSYREWIYGASDSRSSQVKCYIKSLKGEDLARAKKILFNFGYYEEKFVITSGITRDTFGNVIDIETIDDYGKNTSDGVLSVSMYHTRSKAFYQKHHFLFATTEEYMSKVMYGKSSYTGEYYADRIKITHGNDGPRGILSDTLVIDSSSLYPKDELVINKDFEKASDELEETFTYFPVTAPYSPLSDGPNARYGLALKKSEREPVYTDNKTILNIARNELIAKMGNIQIIESDTPLPQETFNGCKIYWSIVEGSNWIEDEDSSDNENINIEFADSTVKTFIGRKYNANNVDIVVDGFVPGTSGDSNPGVIDATIEKASVAEKTVDFLSTVVIKPTEDFAPGASIKNAYYGYSSEPITILTDNTAVTKVFDDGTDLSDNIHEYAYKEFFVDVNNEIPFESYENDSGKITAETGFKQKIFNAHPDKYLNIFFTENSSNVVGQKNVGDNETENVYNKIIRNYISLPLHYEDALESNDKFEVGHSYFDLLQYPCTVIAYTTGITNINNQGILDNSVLYSRIEYDYRPYNVGFNIKTQNMGGGAKVLQYHYSKDITKTITANNVSLADEDVLDDLYVNITK